MKRNKPMAVRKEKITLQLITNKILRKELNSVKIFSLINITLFLVSLYFCYNLDLQIYDRYLFIPFIFINILILFRFYLLKYRINNGYYGNNSYEARELIRTANDIYKKNNY